MRLFCSYQYDWVLEEAKKNILRTHTTAVSARMLYKLAQQVCFKLLLLLILFFGQFPQTLIIKLKSPEG